MQNPFRNAAMRRGFDDMVNIYRQRHQVLFINGERRRPGHKGGNLGSSFATSFWRGYDGVAKVDDSIKGTHTLINIRAGEACRKYEPLPEDVE